MGAWVYGGPRKAAENVTENVTVDSPPRLAESAIFKQKKLQPYQVIRIEGTERRREPVN